MENILDTINSIDDLKKLPQQELPQLAEEIRELIINTVSKTGGHLASSLGVVELTLALHYVYNLPTDKIIWDVGHQSYCHKILTGRKDSFHLLRQYNGISGFPHREESPFDAFGTGHSSTSISAALGIAEARDLKKEDYHVLAVIGDGALTGGMAFEALNHAGDFEKKNITVILNDNEMSISPNVGALSSYLGRLITNTRYNKMKGDIESILKSIPSVGNQMFRKIKKLEERIKSFFVPGILFQELGFKYVGPIPGHNFNYLIETFNNVNQLRGPILIHVVTKKGKGYNPSEEDASAFHGASPFYISNGKFKKKTQNPSYTEIFSDTLIELAKKDEKVLGITAAMPQGTGLNKFAEVFPERFYDVGIAEQHAVTFAAGLAAEGFKPVVAIYSTFLQRAYDQIIHDVCLQKLPVVFALDRAGIVGEDGPTHHGNFDISYLRHIPCMSVMAPKDENEMRHMFHSALQYNCTMAIRYPRGSGMGVKLDKEFKTLPFGKGEVLRTGRDVVLIAIGYGVKLAEDAAEILAKHAIQATVINARFIKPLDEALISKWIIETGMAVTIEENALAGGFGAAILEMLEGKNIEDVTVKRIGLPDQFVVKGSQSLLREKYGISVENIVRTVEEMLLVKLNTHKMKVSSMNSTIQRSS